MFLDDDILVIVIHHIVHGASLQLQVSSINGHIELAIIFYKIYILTFNFREKY